MSLHAHVLIDGLTWGGAETLLTDLAAGLEQREATLTVGYLKDATQTAERLRAAGVEPELVGIKSLLGRRDLGAVRDHLRRVAPDVLHTHLGYSDFLGGRAARSLGIPAVSTLHVMHWDESLRGKTKERLMAFARRHCAHRVICVSEAARAGYLALGWDRPERVVSVPNGVAGTPRPGAGRKVREELGLAPDDLVVAMLSVLRPGKGHDVAAAAVAQLRERFPRIRLLVLGDGPDREAVLASMGAAGDAVVPAGFREDVMEVLDAVDVLVHPSLVDALPTALIEAMAARVPVVATAVGGIPEILGTEGDTGIMISPPPRPGDLAGALGGLLDDDALRARMGDAGRARFEARFALGPWMDRLLPVYRDAISTSPGRRTG